MSETTMMSAMRRYNTAVNRLRELNTRQAEAQKLATELVIPISQAEAEVNKSRDALLSKVEANKP